MYVKLEFVAAAVVEATTWIPIAIHSIHTASKFNNTVNEEIRSFCASSRARFPAMAINWVNDESHDEQR